MATESKRNLHSFLTRAAVLLTIATLIIGTLAGCGSNKKDEKKDNSSDIPLTQTFTNEEVGLTVQYPEGWVADIDSSGAGLASSQAAFDDWNKGNLQTENDMLFSVEVNPLEELGASDLDGVFTAFRTELEQGVTVSEVTNVKIGGTNAKRMTLSHSEEGDVIMFAWMLDDGKTVLTVLGLNGGPGKLDTLESYALAIAKSVKVTPPAE